MSSAIQILTAVGQGVAADTDAGGLNYLQLILHASLPVQIVMLLLVAASVLSWFIIFGKSRVFRAATLEANHFEDRFWSGTDLNQLYREATDQSRGVSGLEAIFEAGYREFLRLRLQQVSVDARTQVEGAQRAMRATLAREVDALEHNLELLANVGSMTKCTHCGNAAAAADFLRLPTNRVVELGSQVEI